MADPEYAEIIGMCAAGLADDEYWCVTHPEGDLLKTASKRFDLSIIVFCESCKVEWDDAQEAGYRLGRVHCAHSETLDAIIEARAQKGVANA